MKKLNLSGINILYTATGIAILVAIGYFIYKKVKASAAAAEIKQYSDAIKPSNLTYSPVDYNTLATRLFAAMDGAGTDEDAIFSVIKQIKNRDDWYQLIKSFGMRESTSYLSRFKGNLVDWLQDELGTAEIEKLKSYLTSINVNF